MRNVVISLGGSIISKDELNREYILKFKDLILSFPDIKFIIVVGGGKISRDYANALPNLSDDDKYWIGIMGTRLNAELVRSSFGKDSYEKVIYDPTKKIETNKKIIIGAGYKPGWSTDYVAVLLAEQFDVKEIINLSNTDFVYDKNPKEFDDAKPIEKMTWDDMKEMFGEEWEPSKHCPFDQIASKKSRELGLKVIIMDGEDLENIRAHLNNSSFKGTTIEDSV